MTNRWAYTRFRAWAMPKRPRELAATLTLLGSLRKAGWLRSATLGVPVDGAGNPVPWWTYSAIAWFQSVLTGEERLFEYGAGQSTLWYATKVSEVHAVEHTRVWAESLSSRLPQNCSLMLRDRSDVPESSPYVLSVREASGPFDVIVVDGRDRVACTLEARKHLNADGLLILDDAHRSRYRPAHEALKADGYLRIDFQGLVAGGYGFGCTSVFSRALDAWVARAQLPEERSPIPSRAAWTF